MDDGNPGLDQIPAPFQGCLVMVLSSYCIPPYKGVQLSLGVYNYRCFSSPPTAAKSISLKGTLSDTRMPSIAWWSLAMETCWQAEVSVTFRMTFTHSPKYKFRWHEDLGPQMTSAAPSSMSNHSHPKSSRHSDLCMLDNLVRSNARDTMLWHKAGFYKHLTTARGRL
jgi:hypothetical protein